MFKVGELITKIEEGDYSITTPRALCIVDEVKERTIIVTVVAHADKLSYTGHVEAQQFKHCTYNEFMTQYPNAKLTSSYTAEQLRQINNEENVEEKKMELRMDKKKFGEYVLTEEERKSLKQEIIDLLEEYDYNPTDVGVNNIIDEWVKNKGWMVNLFKKHPNYNGKYQIVFDTDYVRACDKEAINSFGCWLENRAHMLKQEKKIGAFTYQETMDIYDKLDNICEHMRYIQNKGYKADVNGKTYDEMVAEKNRWLKKYQRYFSAERNGEIYTYNNKAFSRESWDLYRNMTHFAQVIRSNTEAVATEVFANNTNGYFEKAKAVAGQKVSRIVNKVYTLAGLQTDREFNQEFAKYSDGINPITFTRHTILSCHPVDYLTMSFGNSWASCHTIDKHNKRGMPNDYSGCYSSGTLSYMLDETSFVYYTVDNKYNGNEYELQDKINRNMFHIGEDKLVQGRVYPQTTDGETGIYRQIREITQKVIADCLEAPNLWKNFKGIDDCRYAISSTGTHYPDYTNFEDCNVSYLKNETDEINKNKIIVGHYPICPNCGKEHSHQEAVECENCYNDQKSCYNCGYHYDEGDMHYIDGDWYCEDCCFYCEYHEEWEIGDPDDAIYVQGYGKVCEDALEDNDDFYTCDRCGDYFYKHNYRGEDYIETEDDKTFCCESCAERAGYTSTSDGYWYPESEVHFCEHCENDVHDDDWNEELGCCTDCEDEVKAEKEENEVEREAV